MYVRARTFFGGTTETKLARADFSFLAAIGLPHLANTSQNPASTVSTFYGTPFGFTVACKMTRVVPSLFGKHNPIDW
jgi:hypothetical protein